MAGTVANIILQPMEITWGATSMGFTQGDITITTEEQLVDVTAHERGTNVLDKLRTGKTMEISMTLQEFSTAIYDQMYGLEGGGAAHTPAAGTEVVGWGLAKDCTGISTEADQLILHPIKNVGDLDADISFHLAYPMPSSMVFSGENPATMEVTWIILPDLTVDSDISWFIRGDHTQDLA